MLHRVKANSLYIAIGIFSFWEGLAFLTTHKPPFYYPPAFKGAMNSPVFQWLFLIAGILLITYMLSSLQSRRLTGLLLGVIAGLTAILCAIDLEHWIFVGDFGLDLASNFFALWVITWVARHFQKRL